MARFFGGMNQGKAGRFHGGLSRLGSGSSFGGFRAPGKKYFKGVGAGRGFSPMWTLDRQKSYFFSAQDWSEILAPAEEEAMRRSGALYRMRMRWILSKSRGGRHSSPNEAPTRRTGLLRDSVNYWFDPTTMSCLIGPAYIPSMHGRVYVIGARTIPELLEIGGRERVYYDRVTRDGNFLPANSVVRVAARPYVKKTLEHAGTKRQVDQTWEDIVGKVPQSLTIAASKRPA